MTTRRLLRLFALLVAVCALVTTTAVDAQATHPTTVLGSHKFAGKYGEGWGKAHPREIFNGGDPSGLVTKIHWTHWGAKRSYGWGKNAIFKPGGGYYPKPVRIELRAQNLGHCGSHRAYTHLWVREPRKPHGRLGAWHSWSYNDTTLCKNGF